MNNSQSTNYAFQEMSFSRLRALKKKLQEENSDPVALAKLNAFAQIKIQSYISEKQETNLIDPPELFAFIHTFGKENGTLTPLAQKALHKLMPELKRFDEENGLAELKDLPEKKMMENISLLEKFEKINPFEGTKKGLKYEAFERGYKLLNAIKITGDDGERLDEKGQADFRETMLEAARLTTYFQLCVLNEKITKEMYLAHLSQRLEIDLVTLLTADEIAKDMPLTEDSQEKISQFFNKFLESLSE